MLGFTSRQLFVVGVAAVLGLVVAGAAVADAIRIAVAGIGLLLAGLLVVVLDMRRRQGDLSRRLRRVAERQSSDSRQLSGLGSVPRAIALEARRSLTGAVESIEASLDSASARVDGAGERIAAGLGMERMASIERQSALLAEIDVLRASLGRVETAAVDGAGAVDSIGKKVDDADRLDRKRQTELKGLLKALEYEPVRQVQAVLQLLTLVEPQAPLPPVGGWALQPSTILQLVQAVKEHQPKLVVECGSGTSTVWVGYVLRTLGAGRIVALEHDQHYAEQTQWMLVEHGLTNHAEVRHAPLAEISLGDATYAWYEASAVEDLHGIDMLLVDGPPKATGEHARYPALPVLADRLSDGAYVVLDDADRPEEQAAADRWLAEHPGLTRSGNPYDRSAVFTFRPA